MSEYRRIPYRELNENWRTWQRDRYWDRVGWERDREREHGVAPEFRGGEGQNLGRSNQGERQNQTERQNMNRGGYGREER